MLKNIITAGALLTATLVSSAPASAASYYRGRAIAAHQTYLRPAYARPVYSRPVYARPAYAPRFAYARPAYVRAPYARLAYARPRYPAAYLRPRIVAAIPYRPRGYAPGYYGGRRPLVQAYLPRFRFPARQRSASLQRYVAPRSFGMRRVAPAGGAQVGQASYYGLSSRTASGGFVGAATCAHPTLPFGTRVLVTNLANSRQAMLVVNDRGPFIGGRIVDVSRTAAGMLGMLHSGTAPVRVQVVGHS